MEQALVKQDIHFTQTQADSDAHLIALWLHGKAASTQEAYTGDIAQFLAFVDKPLREVRLGDVQAFVDSPQAPSDYTRARRVASVKSLLSFGHKLGYLPFDVGRPIKTPKAKNTLAERIMTEADTHKVIALEPNTPTESFSVCCTPPVFASVNCVGSSGGTFRSEARQDKWRCSVRVGRQGPSFYPWRRGKN